MSDRPLHSVPPRRALCVIGTRPEAVKMAPVVRALRAGRRFEVRVVSTGQHQDLLAQAAADLDLHCDADLKVMRPAQALAGLTARIVEGLDDELVGWTPDVVLAQGDTTSVLGAALTAFYRRIPFAHVEAGLRTASIDSPFPEEANRRLAGTLAAFHFAPTARARRNLLAEGVPAERILVTGNTGIDALVEAAERRPALPLAVAEGAPLVLITLHRRESFGEPLRRVLGAIRDVAERRPDVQFVWPVHPNPDVRRVAHAALGACPNVALLEPQSYLPFVALLRRADVVLTDSGGVQEEAPTFGAPVLVVRESTERPEGVEAGLAELVGTDPALVTRRLEEALALAGRRHPPLVNPYGDGRASARIAAALWSFLAGAHPDAVLPPPLHAVPEVLAS